MVGYMSGSKKARRTPSITNNTNIFGLMGGLAPRVGTSDVAVYRHQQIKGGRGLPELNGKTPEQQQYYMKVNKLLSVNPAGSGGVGKMSNSYHFSCNCSMGSTNQSLVLGSEFNGYVSSINSSSLLEAAHTATQATNNLVFGLRNSSVKFTSPIMKQEAIGLTSQCYNDGNDLKVSVQLSVSHEGLPNPNHTTEIQHDKAIAFIKKHIGNYKHKDIALSEYNIAITGKVDPDYEYGWKITMKNVNEEEGCPGNRVCSPPTVTPPPSSQPVTIQVFVSNENYADTDGPVYAIASLNGYSPLHIKGNESIYNNRLSLNNGNGYGKGDYSTDTFNIVSSSRYFYITLNMGTDNGINIKKVIITYNNHTNIFECNDEYYNPPDNTVGWIDADSIGEHPNNRYYTIYYDGTTPTTQCD